MQKSQTPSNSDSVIPALAKAVILPNTKPIDYVNFVDHQGNAFTMENLLGHWNILFFGFTNCPDICPTTMRTLQQVKQQVSAQDKWGNYRVIMVSVDPERDTLERLNNYVPYFDKEFIGLRSDLDTTTKFAKQLGILFVQQETVDGFYQVDHSASIILVNPAGEMAGVITAPHKEDEISDDLVILANHFAQDHASKPTNVSHQDNGHMVHVNHDAVTSNETKNLSSIEGLLISGAWIRPAPPEVNSMAAYFTLENTTATDIEIVAAQSSNFAMTMIHDTVFEGDIAKMSHLSSLTIPAYETVEFAPLAKHLMLMQPNKPLTLGDFETITLIAKDGAKLTQSIQVKEPE